MSLNPKAALVAGSVAGIGASICCVGPLVLVLAGAGGAWVSTLTALEPLRPILIGLTVLFLALAFHRLYLRPQVCAPGTQCVDARALARQRATFWLVAVPVMGLLAFPWAAPLFY